MVEKIDIKIFGNRKKDKKPLTLGDILSNTSFIFMALMFAVCTFYISIFSSDMQAAMYFGVCSGLALINMSYKIKEEKKQ